MHRMQILLVIRRLITEQMWVSTPESDPLYGIIGIGTDGGGFGEPDHDAAIYGFDRP